MPLDIKTAGRAGTTPREQGACFCTGPRPGEPLCPCRMRAENICQRSGRWIRPEQDLGPAPTTRLGPLPEPHERTLSNVLKMRGIG